MKYMLTLLLAVGLLFSCDQKQESGTNDSAQLDEDYSDFANFYKRFMSDSIFQMEHITFPLQGLPSDADPEQLSNHDFRWQKEDWIMHRAFDMDKSGFKVEFIPISPSVIMEKITHHTGQYGMMRRFAKLSNEWHLIYYAGLNRFAPPEKEQEVPADAG
ncbi:MAG: hypothetical protein DHS20C18_30500 [Saprospiraceae bacterium]|nr:MAG: hypothetical protein DHS20C18_30500 [Saprospiraceae bacterium]